MVTEPTIFAAVIPESLLPLPTKKKPVLAVMLPVSAIIFPVVRSPDTLKLTRVPVLVILGCAAVVTVQLLVYYQNAKRSVSRQSLTRNGVANQGLYTFSLVILYN